MKRIVCSLIILMLGSAALAQADGFMTELKEIKTVVGAIDGSVDITALGGASYTIPIQLPDGINGMQPSLAINYDSQRRNGLLGWGWDLAGVSAITRVGHTIYHDGETKGVDFDDDRFALDGQRLLLVNNTEYGSDGAEYRTEVDGMAKIVSYTNSEYNSPSCFKVWLPNGNIAYYGYKENTRIELQQQTDVCMWMLDSVVDRNGNYVAYRYTKEYSACRLKSILYTGNAQAHIRPTYYIDLEYSNRFDNEIAFVGNNVLRQERILNSIKVNDNNVEKSVLWKYDFEYIQGDCYGTENFYSRLKTINFICNGEKYNPTQVVRDIFNAGAQINNITLGGSVPNLEMSGVKFTGDFNGDGYTDVIGLREEPYQIHVYLNNGHPNEYNVSFTEIATFTRSQYLDWIYVGDFNGDGMDDFMCVNREPGTFFDHIVLKPFMARKNIDGTISFNECDPLNNGDYLIGLQRELTLVMGDFLGNKRMSFVFQTHRQNKGRHIYIYYNGDYSNNCPFESHNVPNLNAKCMRASDFDGDGKTEIWYYSNDDSEWFGKIVKLTPDYGFETINDHVLARNDKVFFGDFNGDGKSDMLTFVGNDSVWEINLFKENSFHWQSQNITGIMPIGDPGNHGFTIINDPETYNAVEVADFNGDGKSDIAAIQQNADGRQYLVLLYAPFTANNCAHRKYISLEDTDIQISKQKDICIGNFLGRENIALFSRNKTLAFAPITDRYNVNQIIDGMGNKVAFGYQYLMPNTGCPSINDFYRITHKLPKIDENGNYVVGLPMKGVRIVTRSNDSLPYTNSENTVFRYQDAIFHNRGRDFLGFETKRVDQKPYLGPTTLQIMHFSRVPMGNAPSLLMDYDSCFVTPRGGSRTVLAYAEKYNYVKKTNSSNNYVYMPLVSFRISDQFDIYNNGQFLNRSIVKNQYDASTHYQNTVHCIQTIQGTGLSATETNVDNAEYKTITENTYQTENYGQWIVHRPYTIRTKSVSQEDPEHPAVVLTTCEFQDANPYNLTRQISYPGGSIDSNDTLASFMTYHYDVVGNVDSTASGDLAGNLPVATVVYEYYPNKHRLKQQTNQAGYVTRYTYDSYGHCNSQRDCNGLVTFFAEDPMGIISSVNYPDGTTASQSTVWIEEHDALKPDGACYYQLIQRSGTAGGKVYYDAAGRKLRTVTYGFDGDTICVDTKYNSSCLVDSMSEPFFFTNLGNEKYTVFKYDGFDRNYEIIAPDETSVATYVNGFTTTTTHNPAPSSGIASQTTYATVNSAGWTVECVDANGTAVNYGYYPDGKLKWTQIGEDTTTCVRLEYDNAGNRTLLTDPNYGTMTSVYNAYGQLVTNTDLRGNVTEYLYDGLGRNTMRIETNAQTDEKDTTSWLYDISGNDRLDYIYRNNQVIGYKYDALGRLTAVSEKRPNQLEMTTSYRYDNYSRIRKVTYPTGYTIRKAYNDYGYLATIKDNNYNPLWETVEVNELGQIVVYKLGSDIYNRREHDDSHRLNYTVAKVGDEIIQSFSYSYDDFSNLACRKDNKRNMEEHFLYDDLNRLDTIRMNNMVSQMAYDDYGRILSKQANGQTVFSGAQYQFLDQNGRLKPHAVSSAVLPTDPFPTPVQSITYTMFDKVQSVIQGNRELTFEYGYGHQRIRMEEKVNNQTVLTKDYYGNCETVSKGITQYYTYLTGPLGVFAVVERDARDDQVSFILKDHLGSWTAVTDYDGGLRQELSFDAWGNLRDPETWSGSFTGTPLFDRGFTGHEHLYDFGLINMNGRIYDPIMSSFLSVDSYVQQPNNSQSFNRYAYCLNNPLKYTDPSGEIFGVDDIMFVMLCSSISSVIINGAVNVCNGRNFYDGSYGAFMGGLASTAIGGTVGGAVAGVVGTEGFICGGITGASAGLFGGYAGGAVGAWCNGASMDDCMKAGLIGGAIGTVTGFVSGGIQGGVYARKNGGDFWSGARFLDYEEGVELLMELYPNARFDDPEFLQNYLENINGWNNRLKTNARWAFGPIDEDLNIEYHSEITEVMHAKGYKWNNNGTYITPKGKPSFGTCYLKNGKIDVCISPFVATNNSECLFESVLAHELTHAVHFYTIPTGLFDIGLSEYYARITSASIYDYYGHHGIAEWHYPSGYNPFLIGPQQYSPYNIPKQYIFSPYNYPYRIK